MTILELGCGRMAPRPNVIRLDADPRLEPDLVCTLGRDRIALPDNSVDVAYATHVLEHIGRQGETKEWFFFWEQLYRVLTPEGILVFESPLASSTWAWADPSHTRALTPESFTFLNQDAYRLPGSSISPFRIHCDFLLVGECRYVRDVNPTIAAREAYSHFCGTLRARKPFWPWWAEKALDTIKHSGA